MCGERARETPRHASTSQPAPVTLPPAKTRVLLGRCQFQVSAADAHTMRPWNDRTPRRFVARRFVVGACSADTWWMHVAATTLIALLVPRRRGREAIREIDVLAGLWGALVRDGLAVWLI